MANAVTNSLPESEWLLISETERVALAELSEDELIELHTRVRRARDKYVKNYRRGASARVSAAGGRGKARPQSSRDRDRAEVFEDALARVSKALSAAARRSAAELKAERLAAARTAKSGQSLRSATDDARKASVGRATSRTATSASRANPATTVTPRSLKKEATSAAQGARRQAKRDSRNS